MEKLLTPFIATIEDIQHPERVFEKSEGQPVAVFDGSDLVGYFVPAAAVHRVTYRYATKEEVLEVLEQGRERSQPILDYLKDK